MSTLGESGSRSHRNTATEVVGGGFVEGATGDHSPLVGAPSVPSSTQAPLAPAPSPLSRRMPPKYTARELHRRVAPVLAVKDRSNRRAGLSVSGVSSSCAQTMTLATEVCGRPISLCRSDVWPPGQASRVSCVCPGRMSVLELSLHRGEINENLSP